MPSINMPSRRESALERLAAGLGIANTILGIKSNLDSSKAAAEDRAKAAKLDDPNFPEAQALHEQYKALGVDVPKGSINSMERAAGKLSDYQGEKFKAALKPPEASKYAVSQEKLGEWQKSGARLLPPGTKGATEYAITGADGRVKTVGVLFPPLEKSKAELEVMAGKQLPADKVLLVNQGNQMPKLLSKLRSTIESNKDEFGPVAGRVGALNPYNRSATAIRSQMKTAAQLIGKYMEDGVLRKEDEAKYEAMLPGNQDTPDSALDKLAIVENMLAEKQQSNIDALKLSGYDVKGLQQGVNVPELPAILAGKKKTNVGQEGNAVASGGLSEAALQSFTKEDADAYAEVQRRLKTNPRDEKALKALRILQSKGQ